MPKSKLHADLVIVGGGVLGTLLAARARKELGASVSVVGLRLKDWPHPRAESLRNQGLAQSGLRYLQTPKIAQIMRASLSMLFDFCSMRAPDAKGVMQMPLEDRDEFRASIAGTGYEREVHEMTTDQARDALGPLWDARACSFVVPEQQ